MDGFAFTMSIGKRCMEYAGGCGVFISMRYKNGLLWRELVALYELLFFS